MKRFRQIESKTKWLAFRRWHFRMYCHSGFPSRRASDAEFFFHLMTSSCNNNVQNIGIFLGVFSMGVKFMSAHIWLMSAISLVLLHGLSCSTSRVDGALTHDDVIKWKHFPRYWPFVRGIHRSPVNSPHKGQWRGALMFSSWGWWFETLSRPLWRQCNDLKSTRSLSCRSLHVILVTKRSRSRLWMTPFCLMSIGPPNPELRLFLKLPLKI